MDLGLEKRFTRLLTQEEVANLSQRDFVDYCREQQWEKISQELFSKPYDSLNYSEKSKVDMEALLRLLKATEEVKNEDESEAR